MLLLGFTPVGNRFTERNLTIFIRKYRCVVGQDNPFQFLFHTMYVCMGYSTIFDQRPITLGSLLVTQIRSHNSFLLAVSMQPYTANGKVLFWYPISLSWPSSEWTQIGPFVVKLPLGFVFFLPTGPPASRPFGRGA